MQLQNTYRLYVKKYNLSVRFLLTSACKLSLRLGCSKIQANIPEGIS